MATPPCSSNDVLPMSTSIVESIHNIVKARYDPEDISFSSVDSSSSSSTIHNVRMQTLRIVEQALEVVNEDEDYYFF